jgi:hypothetical protein
MPVRSDLLWPAVVALLAIITALLAAPAGVVGVLVLVCLAASAERLTRRRPRRTLDHLVVGFAGVVGVLVVVSAALAASPVGLSTRTLGVSLGAVALAGLAASARRQPQPARMVTTGHLAEGLRVLPWIAASLVVVGAAFSSSSASADQAGRPGSASSLSAGSSSGNMSGTAAGMSGAISGSSSFSSSESSTSPGRSISMALGQTSGSDVEVLVMSAVANGPLELRVELGSTEISYPVFYVQPDTTATTRVQLPPTGRYVIRLVSADRGETLASLVVTR